MTSSKAIEITGTISDYWSLLPLPVVRYFPMKEVFMRTLPFGSTGLRLSAVGLGGIQFSKISEEQVKGLIDRARARGINWIETAHGYFDSEAKIGAAVDGNWDGLYIISKNGHRDAEGFQQRFEESRGRLRCDHFDLYQFHGVDSAADWERLNAPGGALDLAKALKRDGLIRHLGVSTHSIELAEIMVARPSATEVEADWLESIQIPISFINREFEKIPLLPRAQPVCADDMGPGGERYAGARGTSTTPSILGSNNRTSGTHCIGSRTGRGTDEKSVSPNFSAGTPSTRTTNLRIFAGRLVIMSASFRASRALHRST